MRTIAPNTKINEEKYRQRPENNGVPRGMEATPCNSLRDLKSPATHPQRYRIGHDTSVQRDRQTFATSEAHTLEPPAASPAARAMGERPTPCFGARSQPVVPSG